MKAAILGTTGYTGQILLRLLASHPEISEIWAVSSSAPGTALTAMDPGLGRSVQEKTAAAGCALVDLETAVSAEPDVVFAALPHLKSAEICTPFFGRSVVIDLSADFRICDPDIFYAAYKQPPPRPDLLSRAVYGLCEWMREEIKSADLIANPGCYPTASLLPILPLAAAGMIEGDILITAMSAISGAGRKAQDNLLFCKRTENVNAYAPGRTHRHSQEIQQEIDHFWQSGPPVKPAGSRADAPVAYFTPHLVPVKQGMAVTTSLNIRGGTTDSEIDKCFDSAYADCRFVGRTPAIPDTAQVRGTNRCDFAVHRDGDRLFLFSVIDNLYKGACGQAVQNMNIRFGFSEGAGLPEHGEI